MSLRTLPTCRVVCPSGTTQNYDHSKSLSRVHTSQLHCSSSSQRNANALPVNVPHFSCLCCGGDTLSRPDEENNTSDTKTPSSQRAIRAWYIVVFCSRCAVPLHLVQCAHEPPAPNHALNIINGVYKVLRTRHKDTHSNTRRRTHRLSAAWHSDCARCRPHCEPRTSRRRHPAPSCRARCAGRTTIPMATAPGATYCHWDWCAPVHRPCTIRWWVPVCRPLCS